MFANLTDEDGFRPSFEAHSSYITGVTVVSWEHFTLFIVLNECFLLSSLCIQNRCGYVVQLLEHQRCAFVEQTPDCHELETYFSYINWVFCNGVGSTLDWVVLVSNDFDFRIQRLFICFCFSVVLVCVTLAGLDGQCGISVLSIFNSIYVLVKSDCNLLTIFAV